MTASDFDTLSGDDAFGVLGFMTFSRVLPGVGRIPSFPPQTPSVYLDDASDLDVRVQAANDTVESALLHDPNPTQSTFPYTAWFDYTARWNKFYAALRASPTWGPLTTTPDEQNAYWEEFEGFQPALNSIGWHDVAPRPAPSDPLAAIPKYLPYAFALALLFVAAPYLAPLLAKAL